MDVHPDCPATASAASSLVRCSVAAIGVSILQYLLDSLGPGWTFTVFGVIGLATAPMLYSVWMWGMQWRTARQNQIEGQTQNNTQVEQTVTELEENEKMSKP